MYVFVRVPVSDRLSWAISDGWTVGRDGGPLPVGGLFLARRGSHAGSRPVDRIDHVLVLVDRPVAPAEQAVEPRPRDARADVPLADGIDDRRWRQPVGLDDGVGSPHLEGVVRVAAADQREIPFVGQLLDQRLRTRVFAVDFDRVEGDILEFPHRAVSEGVGDDGGTIAVVGQRDGLRGRERAGFRPPWWIGADDEDVPAVGRDLDARQRHDGGRGVERRVVVVVGRRDAVEAAPPSHLGQQADAERVIPIAERSPTVEEPRVCVEVDRVHGRANAGQILLRAAGMDGSMTPVETSDRVLVLNPVSGSGDHVDDVVELAADHGFEIRRTEQGGDATRFAREAAPEAALVAAAGGDGTLNAVVNGVAAANALETTTVAVVPAGTGNNFATNVGIRGLEHAFTVIEDGRRRAIDVAMANGRRFVNSCVGGITAEASSDTTTESKADLGVLAYVKNTIETVGEFDSLPLRVETAAGPNGETAQSWEGEALFVLIGNCRRFTGARTAQANVEDGLLEVTIVEDAATTDLLGGAALEGLLGQDSTHIVRRRTPSLAIDSRADSIEYSLDGEILETETVRIETDPGALTLPVGDGYRPDPDDEERWPIGTPANQ